MIGKRKKRKMRGKYREYLNRLAFSKINKNILWSIHTWGGTRCAGCGIRVSYCN